MSLRESSNLTGFFIVVAWLGYSLLVIAPIFSEIGNLILPAWLALSRHIEGTAFYSIVFAADMLIHLVLVAPLAYVFVRFVPKPWLFVIVAVVLSAVWMHRMGLADLDYVASLRGLFGILLSLAPLPIAVLLVRALNRRHIT